MALCPDVIPPRGSEGVVYWKVCSLVVQVRQGDYHNSVLGYGYVSATSHNLLYFRGQLHRSIQVHVVSRYGGFFSGVMQERNRYKHVASLVNSHKRRSMSGGSD